MKELDSTNSFTHLQSKIKEFLQDSKTEYDFIKDFVQNNNRLTELNIELKHSKDNGEKLLKDLNDEIMHIESHIYVSSFRLYYS